MKLDDPAWRERPLTTAWRVATSLVRRSSPTLRRIVVAHDGGRSRIVADLGTPLGLMLYRYGLRDRDLEIVGRLLSPGDVFVDGGANVGLFSLVAASRVGSSGRVLAFEPASETRAALAENVRLNEFAWVEVRSEALAETSRSADLFTFVGGAAGLSSFAPERTEGSRVERVATLRLDDAVPPELRHRVALVKLDVEGAEVAALRGGRALIEEAHPLPDRPPSLRNPQATPPYRARGRAGAALSYTSCREPTS